MATSTISNSTTSARLGPTRRKWFVSFQLNRGERAALSAVPTANRTALAETSAAPTRTSSDNAKLPVGFLDREVADNVREDSDHLLAKRSWDIASQPFKQLPMNLFLAWMAGNSLQLMSLMIVVMLVISPIKVYFQMSHLKLLLIFRMTYSFFLVHFFNPWCIRFH